MIEDLDLICLMYLLEKLYYVKVTFIIKMELEEEYEIEM